MLDVPSGPLFATTRQIIHTLGLKVPSWCGLGYYNLPRDPWIWYRVHPARVFQENLSSDSVDGRFKLHVRMYRSESRCVHMLVRLKALLFALGLNFGFPSVFLLLPFSTG